eukprot:3019300-Lingulodinium_polyedra.AAC.1
MAACPQTVPATGWYRPVVPLIALIWSSISALAGDDGAAAGRGAPQRLQAVREPQLAVCAHIGLKHAHRAAKEEADDDPGEDTPSD